MDFRILSKSQEFQGRSWDVDEARLTKGCISSIAGKRSIFSIAERRSISSIVERQANFNKEPGLLSLNVWVNACKGRKFHVRTSNQ